MGDILISKQALLDELEKLDWQELYLPAHFKDIIDDMPTFSQKPEHGWNGYIGREGGNDDLISRQAAINTLEELKELDYELYIRTSYSHLMEDQWDFVIKRYKEAIKETPCAQQKTAYWIDVSGDVPIYNAGGFTEKRKIGVKCSNCQRLNTWCEFDYCPNCGAKMESEVTSDD